MFEELVEQIRLEYRSGRYGRYDVDRPVSHLRRLLGGVAKVGKGSVGLGTLGTVSVGRHPGSEHGDSVEGINIVLADLRDALDEGRTKAEQSAGLNAVAGKPNDSSQADLERRRMASRRDMGGVLMNRQNMRERGALRGYPQIKADILRRSKDK